MIDPNAFYAKKNLAEQIAMDAGPFYAAYDDGRLKATPVGRSLRSLPSLRTEVYGKVCFLCTVCANVAPVRSNAASVGCVTYIIYAVAHIYTHGTFPIFFTIWISGPFGCTS